MRLGSESLARFASSGHPMDKGLVHPSRFYILALIKAIMSPAWAWDCVRGSTHPYSAAISEPGRRMRRLASAFVCSAAFCWQSSWDCPVHLWETRGTQCMRFARLIILDASFLRRHSLFRATTTTNVNKPICATPLTLVNFSGSAIYRPTKVTYFIARAVPLCADVLPGATRKMWHSKLYMISFFDAPTAPHTRSRALFAWKKPRQSPLS